MTALDVLIGLFLVAFLACIAVAVIKFLEDAKLLTINKYLAMIASWFFWWSCGAIGGSFVLMQWMKNGRNVTATYTSFNYWAFAAITLTYCLVFYWMITYRKKPNSE